MAEIDKWKARDATCQTQSLKTIANDEERSYLIPNTKQGEKEKKKVREEKSSPNSR